MALRRRIFVSLLVILCVSATVAGPVGPVAATDAPPVTVAQLGDEGIEPDGVLLRVDVGADGDATWTIQYRIRLNDENTTAAFESLQEDIAADESAYTDQFRQRMAATAQAAENATGRSMRVENVSVSTSRQQLPQEYGVVTYEFEWVGFAETTGENELQAGDALAGLFLDRQTTLVLAWPEGYESSAVDPSPDERRDDAVVWVGPTDFGPSQPSVTLVESQGGGGEPSASPGDEPTDGGLSTPLLGLLALLALVLVGGAVVLWRRRSDEAAEPTSATADASGGAQTASSEGEQSAAGGAASAEPIDGDGDGDEDVGEDNGSDGDAAAEAAAEGDERDGDAESGDAAGGGASESDDAPWEDELLSNEERVAVLLEHNDGRMKQQAIAGELDWSDAKTSQVIGKMREEGEVETFRLGRENVVSLPDSRLT